MKYHLSALIAGAAFLGLNLQPLSAADWTQYRGPAIDGQSAEKWPVKTWPSDGLRLVWKAPTEAGFSSFVVAEGRAFTLVARDVEGQKREVCIALDATTGKELWARPFGPSKYDGGGDSGTPDNKGGDGPRSTPAFSDGKVYVYGANLNLACFDVRTGNEVWSQDIEKGFGGKNIRWQSAASPVVEGDLVFVAGGGAGQSLMAFNKQSGVNVWKTQDDGITHATPVVASILGVRQVLFLTQTGLVSVKPQDGSVLWRHGLTFRVSTGASPVVAGDIIYCSAGYGVGATVVKVAKQGDAFVASELWRKSNKLLNHWSTPLVHDGHIYGIFGHAQYGKAPLACVDLATGEEKWSKEGFGPGNVILVDGRLVVLADNGELVVIKATPAACTEEGRMKAVAGKCWSTPAFSDGKIFVRSTTEGACFDTTAGK